MISISADIRRALEAKLPVVALESTIIAHGMPYPDNLKTAEALEAIVRAGGATPATIAVIDGVFKVGLSRPELEHIATHPEIMKLSARDLPYAAAKKLSGATTVAATMRLAALAGIRVFATGGIGGVHRGAAESFDISADLTELAETPVAVVSAGAKSILDIGLTLEMLETLGVPVFAYRSDDFPAFYSRASGFKAPMRLDSAREIAGMMRAKWKLDPKGGISIANPIPAEDEVPAAVIDAAIEAALADAARAGVVGKAVTPFLLERVNAATGGRSLQANVALVKNNARLAAEIAVAFGG